MPSSAPVGTALTGMYMCACAHALAQTQIYVFEKESLAKQTKQTNEQAEDITKKKKPKNLTEVDRTSMVIRCPL